VTIDEARHHERTFCVVHRLVLILGRAVGRRPNPLDGVVDPYEDRIVDGAERRGLVLDVGGRGRYEGADVVEEGHGRC